MQHDKRNEGRLWAAFLWPIAALTTSLVLAGCSLPGGGSPLIASVKGLFPEDVTATAQRLPYASIYLSLNGNAGLWVLASQTGDTTYWQSQDATIALHEGYLVRTAGLSADLVDTQSEGPPTSAETLSSSYTLIRTWRTEQGGMARLTANAQLDCATSLQKLFLPLATLNLQRCEETLAWQNGDTTHGTLWRSPQDGRIWAMNTQPWPGAPWVEWEIARPWW